jgi:hypothetical protein
MLSACLPAARAGHLRARLGPRDRELRRARACYDHLAGAVAVDIFYSLTAHNMLEQRGKAVGLTNQGRRFLAQLGIDVEGLERGRRMLCGKCLDRSERRSHLSGALGVSLFEHMLAHRWAVRTRGSRVVQFPKDGDRKIRAWLATD